MLTPRITIFFNTYNPCENVAPLYGRRAVREGVVQPLRRHELHSNVLKYLLLGRRIIHVSKFVLK